ncbi:MFS general substrate transporter [Daedaleopsis nitida]|nr:MFS general substrate transporter [Daedaleopsis nitida]
MIKSPSNENVIDASAGTENEKGGQVELIEVVEDSSSSAFPSSPSPSTNDHALPSPPPALTEEEERRLWRKVDWHIMPIITVMYLVSFVDRSNIGASPRNAKLQGLLTQLNLTGNRYNIALVLRRPSYCSTSANLCSVSLVLKRCRPSRWLPGITVVWGITTTLMGLVKNYPQLVGTRVALGITEAGLAPGVFFYLSMWYPRTKLQTRMGLFWGGATFAGAFSGLLAFVISFMNGIRGLEGWSWIFILEGIATVLVGLVAFYGDDAHIIHPPVLVDFPDTAPFLTPEERAFIVHKRRYENSTVGEEEHFEVRHIWDALTDWQVWCLSLINMSVITPVYGISLFLPSIINGFGFSPAISQLLTVPPYVVGTATVIAFGFWSDKVQRRSPFVLCGQLLCLTGFAINVSRVGIGAKYFGTFLIVSGGYAAYPSMVAWISTNVAGQYKRAVAIPIQVIFGNSGGAIASNVYRVQDAPRYVLGHGIEMMFVGIGLVLLPITVFAYSRLNARKAAVWRDATATAHGEKGALQSKYTPEQLRRMGDRAPDFKYML